MSFNTTAQADSYMSGSINNSGWFAKTDDEKETYLTTAFRMIVNSPSYTVTSSTDDDDVRHAEIELANHLIQDSSFSTIANLKANGINKYKVDGYEITMDLAESQPNSQLIFPAQVSDLLWEYRKGLTLTYDIVRV